MTDYFYRVKARVEFDGEWFIPLDEFVQHPEDAIVCVKSIAQTDGPENYLTDHRVVINRDDVWLTDEDGERVPDLNAVTPELPTPASESLAVNPLDALGPAFRAAFEARLHAGSQTHHDEATAVYRHLSDSVEALHAAALRVLESFDGVSIDELYTVIRNPAAPWNTGDGTDD